MDFYEMQLLKTYRRLNEYNQAAVSERAEVLLEMQEEAIVEIKRGA